MATRTRKIAKRLKITLSLSVILAFVSVSVATYAWFIANRRNRGEFVDVTAEKGLSVQVYAFEGNYAADRDGTETLVGYEHDGIDLSAYGKILGDGTATGVKALFRPLTPDPTTGKILDVGDLIPGVRFSFAFAVTSEFNRPVDLSLNLAGFRSSFDPTATTVPYKEGTEEIIYLTEAIDMMASGFLLADEKIGAIKNFLADTGSTETDLFDQSGDGSTFTNLDLATAAVTDAGSTVLFLYTLEFSDDGAKTFYTFKSINDDRTKAYYGDKGTGNSNVYQNGIFEIEKLAITFKQS